MNTEDLIVDLARHAPPVRRLTAPGWRAVQWLCVSLLCAAAGLAVFGLRRNLQTAVASAAFWATAALAVASTIAGGTAALVLAVPGARRGPLLRGVALACLAAWTALLAWTIAASGHGLARVADWPICFSRVVGISIIPAFVLFRMIRRAAPLEPASTAALAAVGAMAMGGLSIQFICPLSDPGHALFGHLGPALLLASTGALFGRRLLASDDRHIK